MCPSRRGKQGRDIDMGFETFEILSKYFRYTNQVHLQGMMLRRRELMWGINSLELEEVVMCAESPINSFVVSAEGDLYPCVYLSLPFDRIPRIFCGRYVEVERPSFGNVKNFLESWNGKSYTNFRTRYEKRLEAYKRAMDKALTYPLTDWEPPSRGFLRRTLCRMCVKRVTRHMESEPIT